MVLPFGRLEPLSIFGLRNVRMLQGAINAIVWADHALQWTAGKKFLWKGLLRVDLSSKHRKRMKHVRGT